MSKQLVIIGLGNMGGSLVRGILRASSMATVQLKVFDQHPERYKDLPLDQLDIIADIGAAELASGTVVFCVKPQDLEELALRVKSRISASTLIISVLAGTTTEEIAAALHHHGPIVRTMPNIAAVVDCAATGMCANACCSAEDRLLAEQIFNGVGDAYWVKENLMDTVTGLSGSGPAYIYMVIEALTDGGVKMGLPRELAGKLATQTVLGAAKIVKETGIHPAVLKDQVTTPAGTTISALVELEAHGLRSMFVSAVVAATERSKDLGRKK